MGKIKITLKAKNDEEASIPVDPSRSVSLLLRKAMREISTGDEIVSFKGLNGSPIGDDEQIEDVVLRCGDVWISVYEGDMAEEPEPEAEPEPEPEPAPPPVAKKAAPPRPTPPPVAAAPRSSGGSGGNGYEIKATLKGHEKQISALAFSTSDPTLIATGGYDSKVVLWDIGGHQRGGGVSRGELTGHGEAVTCISFNQCAPGILASASGDETIKVWDLASRSETCTLSGGHSDWVKGVVWNPEVGNMLASVSDDGTVLVWDTDRESIKKRLKGGHSDFVTSCAFSFHDSNVLATSSTDKTVVIWNSATGKVIYKFDDFGDEVHTVAWSPTAEMVLATGCFDTQVRIYDASTDDGGGELFKTLIGHKSEVNKVAFSIEGVLASASDDSTIIIWDLETERPMQVLSNAHSGLVSCVAWSTLDANLLATGGEDGTVVVWATSASSLYSGGGGGGGSSQQITSGGGGGVGGGRGEGGGGGGGGASSSEIAALRSDLSELQNEVKHGMKEMSRNMAQMKATVDHILALVSISKD